MAGGSIVIIGSHQGLISKELQLAISNEGYSLKILDNCVELKTFSYNTIPQLIIVEAMEVSDEIYKFNEKIVTIPKLTNVPNIVVINQISRSETILLARMGFQELVVSPVDKKKLLLAIDKNINNMDVGSFRIVEEKSTESLVTLEFLTQLDATNSKNVENFVDHLIINKKAETIIFDFKKVSYLDSSGIGVLIVCEKKMKLLGGEMKIININEQVKKLLTMLQIDKILNID